MIEANTVITYKLDSHFLNLGRFDLNWFTVYCSSCAWKWSPDSINSIIQSGFWPGSPMNVNTFYDQKLFFLWDAFRKQMPGSSQTAFIRSLEDLSHSKNRVMYQLYIVHYCATGKA
jgi:hypothetical protein